MADQGEYQMVLREEPVTHSWSIDHVLPGPYNLDDDPYFLTIGADLRTRRWIVGQTAPERSFIGNVDPDLEVLSQVACVVASNPAVLVSAVERVFPDGETDTMVRGFDVSTGQLQLTYAWPWPIVDLTFHALEDGSAVVAVLGKARLDLYAAVEFSEVFVDGVGEAPEPMASVELERSAYGVAAGNIPGKGPRIFVTSTEDQPPEVYDFDGQALVARSFGGQDQAVGWVEHIAAHHPLVALTRRFEDEPTRSELAVFDFDGALLATVPGAGGGYAIRSAFSSDGRLLIVGSAGGPDSVVTVHDPRLGFAEVGFRRYDADAPAVGFTDSGLAISTGGSRLAVETWEPTTTERAPEDVIVYGSGKPIRSIDLIGSEIRVGFDQSGLESNGGLGRLTAGFDLAVHRWTTYDDEVLPPDRSDDSMALGPGRWFELDADGDLLVQPEGRRPLGSERYLTDFAVDDGWLVAIGQDRVIRLWALSEVVADPDPDSDPNTDPGGPADAEPVLNLIVDASGEWVIWSRSGYYASSANGDRYISYHLNRGEGEAAVAFTADRFMRQLYRPKIIKEAFRLRSEEAAFSLFGVTAPDLIPALPPVVELQPIYWQPDLDPYARRLTFDFEDIGDNPATRIWVLQDGLPLWEWTPGSGGRRPFEVPVHLQPGPNRFRILAENGFAQSMPVDKVITVGPADGGVGPTVPIIVEVDLDVEPPQAEPDLLPEPLTDAEVSATVHGGSLELQLGTAADDGDVELVAVRNGEQLWRIMVEEQTSADLTVSVPLVGGINEVTVLADGGSGPVPLLETLVDLRSRGPMEEPKIGGPGPVPPEPPAPPGGTEAILHAVARGETLASISKHYFGTTSKYRAIFEANRPPPTDPDLIFPGQYLEIPLPPGEVRRPGSGHHINTKIAPPNGNTGRKGGPALPGPVGPRSGPEGPKTRIEPKLFLLAVGVSKLHDGGDKFESLRFAHSDAAEIEGRFRGLEGDLFASVDTTLLTDEQATVAGIRQAVAELAVKVEQRDEDKTRNHQVARDVVIFFFSGHGTTRPGQGMERDEFFFVCHDFDPRDMYGSALPVQEIGEALAKLSPDLIIMTDACRSGGTAREVFRGMAPLEVAKLLQSINSRSQYIISSTSYDDDSWEHPLRVPYNWRQARGRWKPVGRGLFTHAICRAMDEHRSLTVLQLMDLVQLHVDRWTGRPGWEHVTQKPIHQILGQIPRLEIYRKP